MVETLAGRLEWEQTGDGVRMVLPARLSWGVIQQLLPELGAYFVAFLGLFAIVSCIACLRGLSFGYVLNSEAMHRLYLGFPGCSAGLVLARILPRALGKTVITLSTDSIVIDRGSPLKRSKESYPVSIIQGFSFVERSGNAPMRNKVGQNEIQFSRSNSADYFGTGITREEASALMAKVNEFYAAYREGQG